MNKENKNLCTQICEYLRKIDIKELSGMRFSAVSEKFRVSRNALSKKFRESVGVSFFDFIGFVRMRWAEEILISRPDLTIKEIPEISGSKKEIYIYKKNKFSIENLQ